MRTHVSKQPKVAIGVIGCGAIAEMYHLPALKANLRTKDRVVLVDANPARLEHLAAEYSATSTSSEYQSIVNQVDGVIVATPPATHYEIAKWFLERGVHVLCEKPLTEDAAEAHELVECAERNQVQLAVNQTRRFFPTYQTIRQVLADGELGQLKWIQYHDGVEFDWPAASPHHFLPTARGAWSDTGVHLLDSIVFWIAAKPEFVEAHTDAWGGPESMATVWLRHEACDIEIKVSRLGRLENGFRIEGSQGSIVAGAEDWNEVKLTRADGSQRRLVSSRKKYGAYTEFAVPVLEDFLDSIVTGESPFVTGESTLPTIELLEAAYAHSQPYSAPWNDHWRELARC